MIINIKPIRSAILAALALFVAALPAYAIDDPKATFNPRFPFVVDQSARLLKTDEIRATLAETTRSDTSVVDLFLFFKDGRLRLQPLTPPKEEAISWRYAGKWHADEDRLCMKLNGGAWYGDLRPWDQCYLVYSFNRMLLLAPSDKPDTLAYLWNNNINNRVLLMDDQKQIFLNKTWPAIQAAEIAGDKEAPASSVDKWRPPVDDDARALYRHFAEGGIMEMDETRFEHRADGTLLLTNPSVPDKVVTGRWWMIGRLYCAKYAPPNLPNRTFCFDMDTLAFKSGAEGFRAYSGDTLLYGRALLSTVKSKRL